MSWCHLKALSCLISFAGGSSQSLQEAAAEQLQHNEDAEEEKDTKNIINMFDWLM